MGLRSWITVVNSRVQLLKTIDFAKNKAYGVSYVLQITSEDAPFPIGTVIVAFSSDGDLSCEKLINEMEIYWDDIILLEDFLDDNPSADWHGGENGPGKYGVFLTEEECNKVEIINVPVSFYWYDEFGVDWTLSEKIETDDFYCEKHFLPQTAGSGSFYRICETLEDINRSYAAYNDNPLAFEKGKAVLAELVIPKAKHSNKVTIRYIDDKLYIYYSINIEEILKIQSWELSRAFFDEQFESWRHTTQETLVASEIVIPWRSDVLDTGYDRENTQTVNVLHISIQLNGNGYNTALNISDIQNNINEIVGIFDIVTKSKEALVKIKEKQADTLLNISFCAEGMFNELFNKTFLTATPVYAIIDTWHKERIDEDDNLDCMCICIPQVFPDAEEYDMVTIYSDWDGEKIEFCYNFNIDVLYSDDKDKQEELVNKFETELMNKKKQLEGILRLDDWLKYNPGKPEPDKKTEIRASFGEFEDKLWFCLTTPSIEIYDLSKSMRTVDLLNNWKKIKDIVEKVLEKIEAKR
jgi:hypothetical protein